MGKGALTNVLFWCGMALALVLVLGVAQTSLPPGVALAKPIQVSDGSMAPTLERGTMVIATRLWGNPQRWDVVAYNPREGALEPGRVIGLPGDVVEVRNGQLFVNGLIASEPYARDPITYELPPVTLDAGAYFVLGDNRNEARDDSHTSGPIPRSRIVAALLPLG